MQIHSTWLQLEHIFPLEEEGETAESFENDLKRSIETAGASFIAYDAAFGRWTFMVSRALSPSPPGSNFDYR